MTHTPNWTLDGMVKKDDSDELDRLAGKAAREHTLAVAAGLDAFQHAINAGEALLAAREKVERGHWSDWLADTFLDWSESAARNYMRLAKNKDLLAERNVNSIRAGLALLTQEGVPDTRINLDKRATARSMVGRLSQREIAEELGVSLGTVQNWIAPERERALQAPRAVRGLALKTLVRELLEEAEFVSGHYRVSAEMIEKLHGAVDGS